MELHANILKAAMIAFTNLQVLTCLFGLLIHQLTLPDRGFIVTSRLFSGKIKHHE